ncbi:hypothetical protein [Ralstonia phage p2106]|uniref:Uncharacterized protein n=1 Tax=Ralstonia phage p2106 TaxID=2998497 RepID=A0AAE9VPQ9_9CAUD|nr:hypothetical protein [Ralstonia phage p2106]
MSEFNGHKNWNHWNVSLWINNDEGLYNMARRALRVYKNKDSAAKAMYEDLVAIGTDKTPDGAPYSVATIRAAMVDM